MDALSEGFHSLSSRSFYCNTKNKKFEQLAYNFDRRVLLVTNCAHNDATNRETTLFADGSTISVKQKSSKRFVHLFVCLFPF